MIGICPRAADDIDDAVPGSTHFSGEARGGSLELSDGVLGQIGERTAYDFIVVVAVDGNVALQAKPPAELISRVFVFVGSKVGAGRLPRMR